MFTAVRGGDEDAMIRLFGGDPERARPMNLEKLRDHYDKDQILVSGSGPAVVAVENNAHHARFYQRTAEPSQVLMVYPWSDRASQSGSADEPVSAGRGEVTTSMVTHSTSAWGRSSAAG